MATNARDAEEYAQAKQLEGYPTFAEFIARDKDAAIYRTFESLSARNLLYSQSELHELERKLEEQDKEDAKDFDDEEAQSAARLWTAFAIDQSEKACSRRALQGEIGHKIKEYHERLVLESQVLALANPSPHMLESFKRWYSTSSDTPVLWERDAHLYDKTEDLVALAPVDTDRLDVFLKTYFGWFFREKQKDDPPSEIFYFPERRIQRAGAIISTVMSAILLIGAIVCLLQISDQSIGLRVGMIVLFTCLFAGVVGLLTNARRAEIFGATAAYAAVLVVFVSNNFGNNQR